MEVIEDEQHLGHHHASKTDTNIQKVGEIVRKNHSLSIWTVAELDNIDKETVQQF